MNLVLKQNSDLFDTFFQPFWGSNSFNQNRQKMVTDLVETDSNFKLVADLPGVVEKDVTIQFDNGILTLSAERKNELESEEKACLQREISYGKIERSFNFGDSINEDEINATFKNGVLEIILPKKETKKPKLISLN